MNDEEITGLEPTRDAVLRRKWRPYLSKRQSSRLACSDFVTKSEVFFKTQVHNVVFGLLRESELREKVSRFTFLCVARKRD